MVSETPTEPEERQRTGGVNFTPKSSFTDLLKGNISLELSLSSEDRELIGTKIMSQINEIGDKVDYRWKITQWLMVLAIALGVIGEGVKYL